MNGEIFMVKLWYLEVKSAKTYFFQFFDDQTAMLRGKYPRTGRKVEIDQPWCSGFRDVGGRDIGGFPVQYTVVPRTAPRIGAEKMTRVIRGWRYAKHYVYGKMRFGTKNLYRDQMPLERGWRYARWRCTRVSCSATFCILKRVLRFWRTIKI